LATWCSDCGEDIFLTHVKAELTVTRLMVEDVPRREEHLGKRVAAKDLENCLEDIVSIFEAAIKAVVRRALIERGDDHEQVETKLKKIGNAFQNIERTKKQLSTLFGYEPVAGPMWERLTSSFEKRHPVTHNLGIVDRKYLEKVQRAEREGRDVLITGTEISQLLEDASEAISLIHSLICNGGLP